MFFSNTRWTQLLAPLEILMTKETKEYISGVRQKMRSGFKKRARAVKIPISTIRAIIKNFQSTENVTKLPGRGRVSISS